MTKQGHVTLDLNQGVAYFSPDGFTEIPEILKKYASEDPSDYIELEITGDVVEEPDELRPPNYRVENLSSRRWVNGEGGDTEMGPLTDEEIVAVIKALGGEKRVHEEIIESTA